MIARVSAKGFTSTCRFGAALLLALLTTALFTHAPAAHAAPGESWTQTRDGWALQVTAPVVHNDRLWMIDYDQKVWSSGDGRSWQKGPDHPQWGTRESAMLVSFKDKLWLIGGSYTGSDMDVYHSTDTWSSVDGATWSQSGSIPWDARLSNRCVACNGKLWIFYDLDEGDGIWSSDDGIAWTKATSSFPWKGLRVLASASNGATMFIVTYDNSSKTKVWSSSDGLLWTLASTPEWGDHKIRYDLGFVFHGGKLWAFGGGDGTNLYPDAWTSDNGVTWTKAGAATSTPVAGYRCVSFHNQLWSVDTSVWSSNDAISWSFAGPPVTGPALVHEGEMWVFGDGFVRGTHVASLAHISDGDQWTVMPPNSHLEQRTAEGFVAFDKKLWILGGNAGNLPALDVWSTPDGNSWDQVTTAAPWAPRTDFGALAFKGKIWLLGGNGSGANHNDVWSSPNGKDWTQVAQAAPWEPRTAVAAVVFDERIWVLGGLTSTGSKNDVWSSANGIDWELATASAPWAPRAGFNVTAADGKIWVSGGYRNATATGTDLWTSEDGRTWTQVSDSVPLGPGENMTYSVCSSVLAYKGKLWRMFGMRDIYTPGLSVWASDGIQDSDNDGIPDAQELVLGTDPDNADTDNDLMPDGWERDHGLDPVTADGDSDADNDGPTNLQEYLLGTDPSNPADPAHDLYVDAANGDDFAGTGASNHPYKTIAKAMVQTRNIGTVAHPFTIHAAAGTYSENVVLEPHVRLVGAGVDQTIVSFYDPLVTDHIVVAAGQDTAISNLKVTVPSVAIPAPVVLVSVNDVAIDIGDVVLDGRFKQLSTGVLASGPNSSGTLLHDSTVMRVRDGVWATDSAMQVARNVFENILNDAVFVLVSDKAARAATPQLGAVKQTTATGFNTFRNVTGKLVYNFSSYPTLAQLNDWGAYTDSEIADKVVGAVDYTSFLHSTLAPGTAAVTVFDVSTQSLLDSNALVEVHVGGAKAVAERDPSGVFLVRGLADGRPLVWVNVDGYRTTSAVARVSRHSVGAVTLKAIPKESWVPGDIDLDGKVEAIDVQLAINAALALIPGLDADLNYSGTVDAVDVQLAINAALGLK